MAVQTRIQVRRGTLSQWNAAAAVAGQGILYQGEIGYETDTGRFKIGDGTTSWASLSYASVLPSSFVAGSGIALTPGSNGSTMTISLSDPTIQVADITDFAEGVDDRVATLLQAGNNISLNYNDAAGTLTINSSLGLEEVQDAIGANVVGGSGISVSYNDTTGNTTISLSDPTIQVGDITDFNEGVDDRVANLLTQGSGIGLTYNDNANTLQVAVTGIPSSLVTNFDSQVRTSRLDQMSAPTADVSFNSRKITNLADPTNDQDAATKAYVDAARSGLDVKQSVRVATTANITLSGTQTIDGVAVVAGDRVLVKDQSTASQNGIYVVAAGSWSRSTDADTSAEVTAGMFTFVAEGATNADSGWILTTNDTITLGTTPLAFAQFSGAGQITAGAGMTKNGNTLDVGTASSSRIVVNADNIDLALVNPSSNSGSAGINFVQSATVDSYGRVTAVTTADVRDATTSVKGIASFDTGDFSVTNGAVSIKSGGVDNSQLANSSVTVGTTSISLGTSSPTLAGLSSVTSTSFVGALTGNASTATALQTARTINGASFDGTANITIQFVDGGTP